MTETLPTFRVHFHDGNSVDVDAEHCLVAEARAIRRRPGHFVRKVELIRNKETNQ